MNGFTEEEITIVDGPSPPYSTDEIEADAEYHGFQCPISLFIPAEMDMVKWLGQIYDRQSLQALRLASNPGDYRNPLTNGPLSPAEFFHGDTPVPLTEKLLIRRVSLSYRLRSNRRDAKKRYDLLRNRLNQRIALQASQMETRAMVQNMGGSTVASPPRAMVNRLIQGDDFTLQVIGQQARRVSAANNLPNINLDSSDDEAPTINPMEATIVIYFGLKAQRADAGLKGAGRG